MSSSSDHKDTTLPVPSYRPVVIVHGLMTGDVSTMQHLATRISELHPGTKTYVINRFCGLASLEPLWRQTRLLADDLLQICSLHPEGVNVIGYSQGGLISRGMIEMYGAIHNVKTFVSLSSPQGGQFGDQKVEVIKLIGNGLNYGMIAVKYGIAECFTNMFPALTARTAYEVFYTRLGQHALSVANYWYDPRHRDLYLKYSVYLAVIDNIKQEMSDSYCQQHTKIIGEPAEEIEVRVAATLTVVSAAILKVAEGHDEENTDSNNVTIAAAVNAIMADISTNNPDSDCNIADFDSNANANTRKLGLTRLQKMVLIGGPDDGVISPWQSSQFGILDSNGELVPMRDRLHDDVYSDEDPIGLRQLDITNRLIEYTIPGVGHHEWHCNEKVLRECIIDWLD